MPPQSTNAEQDPVYNHNICNVFGISALRPSPAQAQHSRSEPVACLTKFGVRNRSQLLHQGVALICVMGSMLIVGFWLPLMNLPQAKAVEVDSLIDEDPRYPEEVNSVAAFSPRLRTLWIQALSRPELDLQRQAADAIVRAHRRGMTDLEACVPALLNVLTASTADSVVKQSAAQALIELDARQTAPQLLAQATTGDFDLARIIEPALARWRYEPAQTLWRERLSVPGTPRNRLVLAIRAIAETGDSAAVPGLQQIVHDPASRPDLRLEAAQALHRLQPPDLLEDARKLVHESPQNMIVRLLAATLLQSEQREEASDLLQDLAGDAEPAIATLALRPLVKRDPKLVQPVWNKMLTSQDPELKLLAIETLHALRSPQAISHLGHLLADTHPDVRQRAQEVLVELAPVSDLSTAVRRVAMNTLQIDHPDALEQAILVLGAVEHDPAADRLVELLEHPHPKVFVTAAWALRRLAVPQTASAILAKAQREVEISLIRLPLNAAVDWERINGIYQQLGHLIEALVVLKHAPAEPLLRTFLPNPPEPVVPPVEIILDAVFQPELRSRAIWGLGHLHADAPEQDLVSRLHDLLESSATGQTVRCASVVALGRMKAASLTDTLRELYESRAPYNVGHASRWALEKIYGQPLPILTSEPETHWQTGWFLEPIHTN